MTLLADFWLDLKARVKAKGHGKPHIVTDGSTITLYVDPVGTIMGVDVYDDTGDLVASHTNIASTQTVHP